MSHISINKTAYINLLSTVILQGIAFISAPIFSRILGTGNYGRLMVYSAWVSMTSIVFSLQAGASASIGKYTFTEKEQKKYQSSILSLSLILYAFFSLITLFVSYMLNIDYFFVVCMLLHGAGYSMISFVSNIFVVEFQVVKNLVLSVCVGLSELVLSIVFILNIDSSENYKGRIIGTTITYIIAGVIMYLYIFESGKCVYDKKYWKFTLAVTVPTVFHLLANFILAQSDRLMIDAMIDSSSTGIYSFSANFTSILSIIYSSLNISWVPFFYLYLDNHDDEKIIIHSKNYLEVYTIIVCGFMLLSREIYWLMGGDDYLIGADYIPLLSLGAYFLYLYSFAVNYEFFKKKTKLIAMVTIIAALLNIFLNYFLINYIGVIGAVVSTVISYCLQFILHFISAKYILSKGFPYKFSFFLRFLLIVCICCILSYVLKNHWIIRYWIGICLGGWIMNKIIKRKGIF